MEEPRCHQRVEVQSQLYKISSLGPGCQLPEERATVGTTFHIVRKCERAWKLSSEQVTYKK